MSKIQTSQKSPLKAQQGHATTTALLIILLIPCGWVGYKIGLMYWDQFAIQRAVQRVATDLPITRGASDEAIFQELSKTLSLNDITIAPRDFNIDHSTNPPVMQVRIHQEAQLTRELKIVFDDFVKEPIHPTHP